MINSLTMKYLTRSPLWILAVLTAGLFSCEESKQETPRQDLRENTLVTILRDEHYTPEEFVDALGAPTMTAMFEEIAPDLLPWAKGLLKLKVNGHLPALDRSFFNEVGTGPGGTRKWEIQSYTFSYCSQTVDGRDVVMSGRVTFPNNTVEGVSHSVKTLSLHTHQMLLSADCAPTENLMYMPLRALWNSAVIEPDYQQWGINFAKIPDGGGSPKVMARQLADCVMAALEVMRKHDVTLAPDGYTVNWGSSQNSMAALAFTHYYETEAPAWFQDEVKLRSTFTGEGPYDVPYMLFNTTPEEFAISRIILLHYPLAFNEEQLGGYSPYDFFNPWFKDTKIEYNGREYTALEACSMGLDSKLDQDALNSRFTPGTVVAADMLTPEGEIDENSPKARALKACLIKHNDLPGWQPMRPIYIAHCKEDQLSPYRFAERYARLLSENGNNPNVRLLEVPYIDIDAEGLDPHFLISFLLQINMACVKEPEDLMTVYRPVSLK